nr:RecName: Full=Laccase; AltName: Full=Benzenediol:oxygen oxidoreductase; AltName: Full=Diphenol oxidase; AltName: Full=Urishiol oxidase [Hericium coralloides]
AVGDDTPQLY